CIHAPDPLRSFPTRRSSDLSGTGDGAELRVPMTFRALKSGEAKINVDSTTASMADGETLNLREGSSTVTIAAADDGTTEVEPTRSEEHTSELQSRFDLVCRL